MVNVAIAGGSGNVGRTILEVLNSQTRHQPFILTRNQSDDGLGIPSLQVDYTNVEALTQVLEENNIYTVISCVRYSGDALKVAQMNLILAAIASTATKCFVPSTFGIAYPLEAVQDLPILADYFGAIETLKQSDLQWTVFQNGCFLDYWGLPHIKSFLRPSPFGIDLAHREAAIPGDGNTRFTVTYSFDVAKFVVAALDLDEWPEVTRVAGDVITWNEFLRLAEDITNSKFKVTYDSLEKLEQGNITELPSQIPCYADFPKPRFQWFMAIFSRWTAEEKISHVPAELNFRFPSIKPLTVKEMLETYWKEE